MSTRPVVSVEHLSKYYRLGLIGGGTLREDVNRLWAHMRGRPDPMIKIGEEDHGNRKGGQIWALRDINLEVKEGEILGIIGRNGAGKSTLLKILSRITAPTEGRATIRGRVGSLLEVGTGFHPELTGRENTYLNGTILGMSRAEVKSKLEEIVEFAEMGKFIDTPVKRYSSGMLVRLAFSVAAHLEPEILIVDEVLAVGDAKFQKKCLGKMKDVSSKGRTVLFVSHNMTSVRSLCSRALLLDSGMVTVEGPVELVIDEYLEGISVESLSRRWTEPSSAPGPEGIQLRSAEIVAGCEDGRPRVNTPIDITFEILNEKPRSNLNFSLVMYTGGSTPVFNSVSDRKPFPVGIISGTCHIPAHLLNDEVYTLRLLVVEDGRVLLDQREILSFKVEEGERTGPWHGKWLGVVRPSLEWETRSVSLETEGEG